MIKRAKAGALRIDKLTVAAEAGRSRTTLYKYPKVIARIEALGKETATTAHDVIAALREDNRLLKRQRQEALDVMAATLLRMRGLERSADAAIRKAVRQAKRSNPNTMVGTGKVITFPENADGG